MAKRNVVSFRAKLLEGKEKAIRRALVNTAKEVFRWMDTQTEFNDVTHNLSDSTGVGIYKDGVLTDWIVNPSPKAEKPKEWKYRGVNYSTRGRDKLEQALSNNHYSSAGKYVLIIFSEAPYGFFVERGLGCGKDGQIHTIGNGDSTKAGYGWWSQGLIPHIQRTFRQELMKGGFG